MVEEGITFDARMSEIPVFITNVAERDYKNS